MAADPFTDEGLMAAGDSPTIARRRVRLALREAREAGELTQLQVAEEMEWSLSKVIRIESGEVSIAPNDLRPLLTYLGVKDRTKVEELLQDAKIARTRQRQAWFHSAAYREHLTEPMRRLIEYEAEAVAIRYYQVYYMPGPLQLPEYAGALLAKWDEEMPADQIRLRVEARRQRRESLLSRLPDVQLYVLLDESVLRRPIGGWEIFAAQLRELHRLADEGLARIRMIPFELDAPVTNNATFDLLSLDSNDEGQVLYRENGMTDELVEDNILTKRHHGRYQTLWHVATSEGDTIDFIRKRIEYLDATIKSPGVSLK